MTTKKPARRAQSFPGVFPYETAAGTRYRYAFDAPPKPDGSRNPKTKRGFLSEQDAWDAMQERKRELRLNGYAEPSDETLQQYFERWMRDTQAGRAASTNLSYTQNWKRLPASFRATKLVKVTPTQIRSLYADLMNRYAAGTAKETRATLRMVLLAAHRERLIPYNPAEGIPMKISRDAEAEMAFDPDAVWSIKEQARFLSLSAHHPHHALWRLLLDSGMRIGEALALTWDDVDLDMTPGVIRVRRTVTNDAGNRQIVGKNPKTPQSRRDLDVQPETIEALRRYQVGQKARRLEMGPLLWQNTGLIFDDGGGGLMSRQTAHYQLKTALAHMDGVRPLTLHGLRHTMAVTWLKAGVEPVVVSKRLGHRDVAFTLNVYAKVSRDWQQSAMDRVAEFMKRDGKPLPPPEPEGMLVQFPEQG